MKRQKLACTQQDITPGGLPCSVIAVFVGLAFLQTAPAPPPPSLLEKRLKLACTTWQALIAADRTNLFAADRTVATQYVLTNIVDSATLAAPWIYEYELSATHLAPHVPITDAARQFLADIRPAPGDNATSSVTYVAMPAEGGCSALLHHANIIAITSHRSYALTITYQTHTVVVTFVHDDYGTVYSAVDSLTGAFLSTTDEPAPLFEVVATRWCVPSKSIEGSQMVANMFSLVAPSAAAAAPP